MASMSILLLVTLVLLSITTQEAVAAERCHPQDKRTLLRIKKELGNPEDLSSWDDPTTHGGCCGWFGVSCDLNTNRVDYLALLDLHLRRPVHIPPSVGNLPHLHILQIERIPNLTGPVPTTVTNLTSLLYLTVSHTSVSGEVPEFLSKLKSLIAVNLSYNNLSGKIPASLPQLRQLEEIYFDGNRLSGSIPDSFGSFGNRLKWLTVSRNRLSGEIPASLGRLNRLVTVDLSYNRFEGDASMLFGSHKRTTQIVLSRNALAFDLGKVGLTKELLKLDLSHNRIFGRLPLGLASLKHLGELDVSYNKLCGQIPKGGMLQTFHASSFLHNKCLCDSPLPRCMPRSRLNSNS